jgi:hypothetical protein
MGAHPMTATARAKVFYWCLLVECLTVFLLAVVICAKAP